MPKLKALPPLEELQRRFVYEPETGLLRHAYGRPGVRKGDVAGCKNKSGRIQLRIAGVTYSAHRVIWCLMTGEDPLGLTVDHINRVPDDNRWSNLRLATCRQNNLNIVRKGYEVMPSGRCRVRMVVDGKLQHIGTYDSAEEAEAAYRSKADELWGEFAPNI